MARDLRVRARITADTRDATRNIGGLRGAVGGLTSFLRSRFVITLGDVTRALTAVVAGIGSFIRAAGEQQDAVNQLDASLRRLGPSSSEVSARLQEQAAALQSLTRFGDEAIIAQQALVSNLGLTAEQIELVSRAAVDLAAGTGRGLEFAFINLARTFSGTAGELSELIPALRELTAEQLRAGEGARIIAEQFSGAAAADAETFRGVIAQLSNAFGDLQEQLGGAIVTNEETTESLQKLRDVISSPEFQASVQELADGFSQLVSVTAIRLPDALEATIAGLRGTAEAARLARDEIPLLGGALRRLSTAQRAVAGFIGRVFIPNVIELGRAERDLALSQKAVADGAEELARRQSGAAQATTARVEVEDRLTRILREQSEAQDDLNEALSEAGVSVTVASEEIAKLEDALSETEEAFRNGAISAERYDATVAAINEKLQRFTPSARQAAEATDEFSRRVDEAGEGVRTLSRDIDASSNALERQSIAAQRSGTQLAASLGVVARGSRQQADVNRALAAGIRPSFGGTRIRTVDGGSRLVRT